MKSIYQSKSVWLNTTLTVLGVLSFLQTQEVSPNLLKWLVILSGVANVILRIWFTNTTLV